jgi:hypothetical protein
MPSSNSPDENGNIKPKPLSKTEIVRSIQTVSIGQDTQGKWMMMRFVRILSSIFIFKNRVPAPNRTNGTPHIVAADTSNPLSANGSRALNRIRLHSISTNTTRARSSSDHEAADTGLKTTIRPMKPAKVMAISPTVGSESTGFI